MELKFRSAMNGFNREDVINFIDKNVQEYEQKIQSLQDERSALLSELDRLRAAQTTTQQSPPALSQELEAENKALRQELEQFYANQSSPDSSEELQKLRKENEALHEELRKTQSSAETAKNKSSAQILELREQNSVLSTKLSEVKKAWDTETRDLKAELLLTRNYLESAKQTAHEEQQHYLSQIQELQKEQEEMQKELQTQSETQGQMFMIDTQNNRLLTALRQAHSDLDTANTTIQDLRRELKCTRSSLEEAQRLLSTTPTAAPPASLSGVNADELAAYRRAEAAERNAKLRAEEIERCARKRAGEIERGTQKRCEETLRQFNAIMETAALRMKDLAGNMGKT